MMRSQVVVSNKTIKELYRGFTDITEVCFTLPTVLFGLFGRIHPEVMTVEMIKRHKTTNYSPSEHFVAMTTDVEVAKVQGDKSFITIDPALLRNHLVDVHQTYTQNMITIPGRMSSEAEHISIALLFCSIKSFTLKGDIVSNPFYLSVNESNSNIMHDYAQLYECYLTLLRMKHQNTLTKQDEMIGLTKFINGYLMFYQNYVMGVNPFNLTLDELSKQYPDFMKFFSLQKNTDSLTLFKPRETIGDVAMKFSVTLFDHHPYIQSLVLDNANQSLTIYEDEYARPVYV